MSPPPRDQHRRPYWLLAVFAVLMASPPSWASAALIAAAVGALAVRVGRALGALRGRSRSAGSDAATVLGTDAAGREVRLSDRQLSAHALILGASGAGKSTTLLRILTDHVRRGLPVVAIDMKGSPAFARELADAAAASGRPFRLWSPDGPCHWNPLLHGNATELKDKLIASERFTEPHYQRAAERYVQTVLQVLEAAHPDRAPTLAEVVSLMDPRRLPGVLRGLPSQLVERVTDYVADLPPDQHSAIRGLGARLAIVTESHTGRYLSPPDSRRAAGGNAPLGAPNPASLADPASSSGRPESIDLRDALDGREVVLFSLNSSRYGQLAAQIGTMAVQDLVSVVGRRLSEPVDASGTTHRQAVIGIDEFSALGGVQVVSLLARGRESGGSVLLATQELADLDRAAPGVRDQVIGVTAVKIAHRQDVPSSAQTIAQMAGTQTAWEETHQLAGGLLGGHETGRGTRRRVEQFVVHPNEIKSLRTGEAVLITKIPRAQTRTVRVTRPEAGDLGASRAPRRRARYPAPGVMR